MVNLRLWEVKSFGKDARLVRAVLVGLPVWFTSEASTLLQSQVISPSREICWIPGFFLRGTHCLRNSCFLAFIGSQCPPHSPVPGHTWYFPGKIRGAGVQGSQSDTELPPTCSHWATAYALVLFSSGQFSRLVVSDSSWPMHCSTPSFPVHHQLPEFTQTHWVSDAIQPSHPLLSPSPPTFNLSQHQGLFQWVSSSNQVAKVLEFQLQHQSFQWIFGTDFL